MTNLTSYEGEIGLLQVGSQIGDHLVKPGTRNEMFRGQVIAVQPARRDDSQHAEAGDVLGDLIRGRQDLGRDGAAEGDRRVRR